MNIRSKIPDFITCLNLLCGCLAIAFICRDELVAASILIFAAMVFDFFDGMAARILKASSPIGKQLDSLADMVSFGVVPGFILYNLMESALEETEYSGIGGSAVYLSFRFSPFLLVVCSALRLAKFNIDERQHTSFIGLPTPAAALLVASLPLILRNDLYSLSDSVLNPKILGLLIIMLSYLLVSPLPLFSLKFHSMTWAENYIRYIFIALSTGLFMLYVFAAIPLIILLYILLSITENILEKNKKTAE